LTSGMQKQRTGTVVSDKMDKTITVEFYWSQRDRLIGKSRRRVTKFMAHDENNQAQLGDVVRIEETRPLSRNKRWRLLEILQTGDVADFQPSELSTTLKPNDTEESTGTE
jgi:small subunit ribosomal protein S17